MEVIAMSKSANCSPLLSTGVSSALKDAWSIRPCEVYKEEYEDCTSIKARFHQYFIHGANVDCRQWEIDHKNCVLFKKSNGNDIEAGEAVVRSEEERRLNRTRAHYANDIWKKRSSPPADWAKPLPDWLTKRNENTYLELKQTELDGKSLPNEKTKSFCTIM